MVKDTEGDYVMYDDYVQHLAATRASLDRARELLRTLVYPLYPLYPHMHRIAIKEARQFLADTEPK